MDVLNSSIVQATVPLAPHSLIVSDRRLWRGSRQFEGGADPRSRSQGGCGTSRRDLIVRSTNRRSQRRHFFGGSYRVSIIAVRRSSSMSVSCGAFGIIILPCTASIQASTLLSRSLSSFCQFPPQFLRQLKSSQFRCIERCSLVQNWREVSPAIWSRALSG